MRSGSGGNSDSSHRSPGCAPTFSATSRIRSADTPSSRTTSIVPSRGTPCEPNYFGLRLIPRETGSTRAPVLAEVEPAALLITTDRLAERITPADPARAANADSRNASQIGARESAGPVRRYGGARLKNQPRQLPLVLEVRIRVPRKQRHEASECRSDPRQGSGGLPGSRLLSLEGIGSRL